MYERAAAGHDLGDKILEHIAGQLGSSLRPSDVVGRYGGGEFLVGLAGCALADAGFIAERMRKALAASPYLHDGAPIELSVSIGVASAGQSPADLQDLIGRADRSMYVAKESGRNCVHLHVAKTAA